MKKFSVLVLLITYFCSINIAFAECVNLYFVKNVDKAHVKSIVEAVLDNGKYTLQKKDPYLAISNSRKIDYIVSIIQQTGNNVFYYFQSSDKATLDKQILKELDKENIEYEKTSNEKYINLYSNQAQKVLNGNTNYDFSEPKQSFQQASPKKVENNNALKGYVAKIDKGVILKTYLQTTINTATAVQGDNVVAILAQDWLYNGHVIAPQGSVINGVLSKARHAKAGSINGRVVMEFNSLRTPDGKTYDLSLEEVDITVSNDGKLGRTVRNIAGGAIVGLLGGLLVAAISGDASYASAIAIGAAAGAAGGALKAGVEAGVDAEIPIYTELDLKLTKPLSVTILY